MFRHLLQWFKASSLFTRQMAPMAVGGIFICIAMASLYRQVSDLVDKTNRATIISRATSQITNFQFANAVFGRFADKTMILFTDNISASSPFQSSLEAQVEVMDRSMDQLCDELKLLNMAEEAQALDTLWREGHQNYNLWLDSIKVSHKSLLTIMGELKKIEASSSELISRAQNSQTNLNKIFEQTSQDAKLGKEKTIELFLSIILVIAIVITFSFFMLRSVSVEIVAQTSHINHMAEANMGKTANLTEQSVDLSKAADEQAAAVQESVAALSQITAMIRRTLESTKETIDSSTRIRGNCQRGEVTISDLVDAMNKIKVASDSLSEITAIIKNIEAETQIINDIVFKTQLLSFNASIEAARAGHHGRGFSVVAEEIGSLARSSGEAANSINKLISSSVSKVNGLLDSTQHSTSQGESVASAVSDIFTNINSDVDQMLNQLEQVNNASSQQELGIGQVQLAVQKINDSVLSTVMLAQMARGSAEDLSLSGESLIGSMATLTRAFLGVKATEQKLNVDPGIAPVTVANNQVSYKKTGS